VQHYRTIERNAHKAASGELAVLAAAIVQSDC
jgi:hypothetical protein